MEKQLWPSQTPAQIVEVSNWLQHEDPEIFPVGSKPKKFLICPEQINFPFLIPGHKYMFKTIPDWREQQLWSEIIAYELSKICGIEIPPCFVATNAQTNETGVLMEFFYGYPDEKQSVRFVAGTDLIQRFDPNYDPVTGRPHDVQRNIGVCRLYGIASRREWWAKTLAFDALIGNTDRHAENWGLLRGAANDKARPEWRMAPPFDHGTSLGYEILEKDLKSRSELSAIARHVSRGRHHCTWAPSQGKHGDSFFTLCARLCATYPELKAVVGRLIPTLDAPINEIVSRWEDFEVPIRFTAARANFIERLIRARRNALVEQLGL